jgi:phytoene synthase
MDGAAHCMELVRRHDRDGYLASLFAPDGRRPALLALYAFDLEVSRIAGAVSEAMLGEVRLQWWRETLEAVARGEAVAHPVAQELGRAMLAHQLPLAPFVALVTAHEFDLLHEPMRDVAALETYLGQTVSAVIQLAAIVLAGGDARHSADAAGLAGVALGLTRLIRRRAAGDLRVANFFPPELADEMAVIHARQRLAEARGLVRTISKTALPAFLPAGVAALDLVMPNRQVPQFRRQLYMWWQARRNRF